MVWTYREVKLGALMSVVPAELVLVVFESAQHPSNKHDELTN
jgi:hypothetical protein